MCALKLTRLSWSGCAILRFLHLRVGAGKGKEYSLAFRYLDLDPNDLLVEANDLYVSFAYHT